MKTLGKLKIDSEKIINDKELQNLKGEMDHVVFATMHGMILWVIWQHMTKHRANFIVLRLLAVGAVIGVTGPIVNGFFNYVILFSQWCWLAEKEEEAASDKTASSI